MHNFLLRCLFFVMLFFLYGCDKQNGADVIYSFYEEYIPACNVGNTDDVLSRYCSKKLLTDLDILYSFDSENSIIVGIDYDPFLNAQDILPFENLKVSQIEKNLYYVTWNGVSKPIKIKLVKENGKIKIDELDSYDLEQVKKDVDAYWKNKKSVKN